MESSPSKMEKKPTLGKLASKKIHPMTKMPPRAGKLTNFLNLNWYLAKKSKMSKRGPPRMTRADQGKKLVDIEEMLNDDDDSDASLILPSPSPKNKKSEGIGPPPSGFGPPPPPGSSISPESKQFDKAPKSKKKMSRRDMNAPNVQSSSIQTKKMRRPDPRQRDNVRNRRSNREDIFRE